MKAIKSIWRKIETKKEMLPLFKITVYKNLQILLVIVIIVAHK